jgi:peptide chain release factor 1
MDFIQRLNELELKFQALEQELATPEVYSDREKFKKLSRTLAELKTIVEKFREYRKVSREIEDNQSVVQSGDRELGELAKAELETLEPKKTELEAKLKELLVPPDPDDARNAILEIRAGTGGEEAALFARELMEMYVKWLGDKGVKFSVLNHHPTDLGGLKEIISQVEGPDAFGWLKFESGVHRVQRVPDTEQQGRVHTSTVTVAVLPEAEEVDISIDESKDLRIDVYRSQGKGGQGVNTTDSAVRITHLPTGMVVTCQDERSQHKNKSRAMKILKARLYEAEKEKLRAEREGMRRGQVGSGERAEKIRTYNFPQNRLTDHRVNITLYKLDRVMQGDLDELVSALRSDEKAQKLVEFDAEEKAAPEKAKPKG